MLGRNEEAHGRGCSLKDVNSENVRCSPVLGCFQVWGPSCTSWVEGCLIMDDRFQTLCAFDATGLGAQAAPGIPRWGHLSLSLHA